MSAAKVAHSSRSEPDIDQNLEIPWESQQGRFLFVVDCQPVQRLACGHTSLLNEQFRPPLHRIVDNLAEFIGLGLLPPSSAADPVLWAKRDRNSAADYLWNYTMDTLQCAWSEERDSDVDPLGNAVILSDGGTRTDCSASSWVLCVLQNGVLVPKVAGGLYFNPPISSFAAETIALEKATDELRAWLAIARSLNPA